MALLFLLCVTFFMQLLTATWYDLASKTHEKSEIFKYKMLCSLIYFADFLLCSAIGESYKILFFIPFALGFTLFLAGDILESKLRKNSEIIAEIVYSAAKISFSAGFMLKLYTLFPKVIESPQPFIILLVVLCFMSVIIAVLPNQTAQNKLKMITIVLMYLSALPLAILLQKTGIAKMQASSCALILGMTALTYFTLSKIIPKKNDKPDLSNHAYFFGLMLIACSII